MSSKSRNMNLVNLSNQRKPIQKTRSKSSHSDSDEEFEVEKIIDCRFTKNNKSKEYLVKWKNWPIEDSTWEPVEHLSNVKDIVAAFEKNNKKKEPQQQQQQLTQSSPAQVSSKIKKVVPQVKPTITRNEPASAASSRKEEQRRSSRNRAPSSPLLNRRKPQVQMADNSSSEEIDQNISSENQEQEIEEEQEDDRRTRSNRNSNDDNDGEDNQDILESNSKHRSANHNNNESNSESQSEQIEELVYERIISRRDTANSREYLVEFQKNNFQWIREEELSDIMDEVQQFNAGKDREEAEEAMENEQQSSRRETRSKDNGSSSNGGVMKKTAKRSNAAGTTVEVEKAIPPHSAVAVAAAAAASTQLKSNLKEKKPSNSQTPSASVVPVSAPKAKQIQQVQPKSMREDKDDQPRASTRQKLKEISEAPTGDFKSDNVAKLVLQGTLDDIMSSRFEVYWKQRKDGSSPSPCVFSSAYLKRFEPALLIDFLIASRNDNAAEAMIE